MFLLKLMKYSLKPPKQDLLGLSTLLNWRGLLPFAELSGTFPLTINSIFEGEVVNFSTGTLIQVSIGIFSLKPRTERLSLALQQIYMVGRDSGVFLVTDCGIREMVVYPAIH